MTNENIVTRISLKEGVAFLSMPKRFSAASLEHLKAVVDIQLKAYQDMVEDWEFVGPKKWNTRHDK